MSHPESIPDKPAASNFIREIIESDLRSGKTNGKVVTRFPPEPNGYLHIGHAKSICLNFGLARDYGGVCHLRFDDTNPTTEEVEYVESIKNDVHWLGFDWADKLFFASDYFEELYARAELLIRKGLAYVDSLSEEEIREYRGTVTEPGRESPYRARSVDENLDLFRRMRAGEFPDGSVVLRAKIDMASPNMLLRDPVLYRIKHAHHHRTGDDWCIYPMYDYAHPLSDAVEGITHSICTLEFEVHRPLYDWVVENTWDEPLPHQYEFARLNLDFTVMSKRKLLQLVNEKHVSGWDDPRMPTISGMRRRGLTPASIRMFADLIGVAKADNRIDIGLLEYCIRTDLNAQAPRVMAVLKPLKVVLTNYPDTRTEELDAPYFPHDIGKEGSRPVPFSRELFVERDDFAEDPPKGFFRLSPGAEVRLRYAYIIRCDEAVRDPASGEVVELRCTVDFDSRSGSDTTGKKVKGTIHWVSAPHSVPAEVRLYDRLFTVSNPDAGPEDFKAYLNPDSVEILRDARLEPSVALDPPDLRYQFTRLGYFAQDSVDSAPDRLVFNRIVTLRDTWAKKTQLDGEADAPSDATAEAREEEPTQASPSLVDRIAALSEKRRQRYDRYAGPLELNEQDALVLAESLELARFFELALEGHDDARSVANWVVNELPAAAKGRRLEALPFEAPALGRLITLIERGVISNRIAKDVLAEMVVSGEAAEDIVRRKGLEQVSDRDALEPLVDRVFAVYPDKVAAYRGGKTGLMGFFIGQVMKETDGKADPKLLQEILTRRLAG